MTHWHPGGSAISDCSSFMGDSESDYVPGGNKISKKQQKRRQSNDAHLHGWSSQYPNLTGQSMESNLDVEEQLPVDLKSVCATGLSIFPRIDPEQEQSTLFDTQSAKSSLSPPISPAASSSVTATAPQQVAVVTKTENEEIAPEAKSSTNTATAEAHTTSSISISSPSSPTTTVVNSSITTLTTTTMTTTANTTMPNNNIIVRTDPPTEASHNDTRQSCPDPRSVADSKCDQPAKRSKIEDNAGKQPPKRNVRSMSMDEVTYKMTPLEANSSTQEGKTKRRRTYTASKLNVDDTIYHAPFRYGWKRELVIYAPRGDCSRKYVAYLFPGKKPCRVIGDIANVLDKQGPLSLDNFCFEKRLLGASPEFETVRHAQPRRRSSIKEHIVAEVPKSKRLQQEAPISNEDQPQAPPVPAPVAVVECVHMLNGNSNEITPRAAQEHDQQQNLPLSTIKPLESPQHRSRYVTPSHVLNPINLLPKQLVEASENVDSSNIERNPLPTPKRVLHVSEIEEPGTVPPENLFDEEFPRPLSRTPMRVVVINSRKALEVSGDLPQSRPKLVKPKIPEEEAPPIKQPFSLNVPDSLFSVANTTNNVLCRIFKYLNIKDISNVSKVCKSWTMLSRDHSLWHFIKLDNIQVWNWSSLVSQLCHKRTHKLDMRGVIFEHPEQLNQVDLRQLNKYLRILRTNPSDAQFISSVCKRLSNLQELRITSNIQSQSLMLNGMEKMLGLTVLEVHFTPGKNATIHSLEPISQLIKLEELNLRGLYSMSHLDLLHLKNLSNLKTLVLSSYQQMQLTAFGEDVLPYMTSLQRLRFEIDPRKISFDVANMIKGLSYEGCRVKRLELINIKVDKKFNQHLKACKSIEELLLIPSFLHNSAKITRSVMKAIKVNANQLKRFQFGITYELLNATRALISQQADCIPIALPIPGVRLEDKPYVTEDEMSYLPVDKLVTILQSLMPDQGTVTVVKLPQAETTNSTFESTCGSIA